ncbi:MAG: tetratricopeptide repeat protein [Elusimicrobia bacterium]|nr:tetratricopeptide repeat protein [Elusimicrobiota bacterium]
MRYALVFVFLVSFPAARAVFARTPAPEQNIAKSVSQALQSAKSGRTGEALETLLRTMELHPDDASLVIPHLDGLVGEIYTGAQKRILAGDPLSPRKRRAILETTYKSLLSTVEDEAMRALFLNGRKAFDEGRFLEAYDLFLLCRFLGPPDGWLSDAVENYLKDQIPEEIESRFSKKPSLLAETYLSGFKAFAELNWNGALKELESHSWSASRHVKPADKSMVEEIARMAEILRIRAIKPETPKGLEFHINRLCSDDAEPAGAAAGLTRIMLYYHDRNAPWWKSAASGIRKAYTAISVSNLVKQARLSFTSGDLKKTTKILITALQKSPQDPGALSLLDEMQASARSRQKPAVGPPPETAPVRKKTPTLAEKIQAQAYYNRGLSAYLQGNIKTAAQELDKAMVLDPDDEEIGKALERMRKELGLGGKHP